MQCVCINSPELWGQLLSIGCYFPTGLMSTEGFMSRRYRISDTNQYYTDSLPLAHTRSSFQTAPRRATIFFISSSYARQSSASFNPANLFPPQVNAINQGIFTPSQVSPSESTEFSHTHKHTHTHTRLSRTKRPSHFRVSTQFDEPHTMIHNSLRISSSFGSALGGLKKEKYI